MAKRNQSIPLYLGIQSKIADLAVKCNCLNQNTITLAKSVRYHFPMLDLILMAQVGLYIGTNCDRN